MNEIPMTVVGNLTGDPELRFTPNGDAVANFTVASTPRVYDRQSGEWRDGEPVFMRCNAWRQAAENMAESLRKGDRVVVTGKLRQRMWQTREGENRSSYELDATDVGASMTFRPVQPRRSAERTTASAAARTNNAAATDAAEPPF